MTFKGEERKTGGLTADMEKEKRKLGCNILYIGQPALSWFPVSKARKVDGQRKSASHTIQMECSVITQAPRRRSGHIIPFFFSLWR